jgi:hypothetical protein
VSSDSTTELLRALIDNLSGSDADWAALALVVDLRSGRVSGTHGYTYSPEGTISAVAARPSGINAAVQAFLDSHDSPQREPPVAFLVQVDRGSGAYEVTFEHDDPARWKVTPATIDQLAEALRPTLD